MQKKRPKALILLNSSAGTGKAGLNTWTIVRDFAGNGYEPIVYPIGPGTIQNSETLLKEYDGEADIVLCSGGDGTLNHVINGVMGMNCKPRVAYIPSGSTNDFAKTLGIPTEFDKALSAALHGEAFPYDVGYLNDRYFNYVAAFGAFSAISYATDQQLKNILGHAAYILSAIAELGENIRYSRHMQVRTDDFTEEDDYIFGAVCNSAYVAGFSVFRGDIVDLDDGKMEIILIKTPQTGADLQGILNAVQKGTLNHPFITFRHIHSVRISSAEEISWTVDGEFGGSYKESIIEIKPKAISIMRGNQ